MIYLLNMVIFNSHAKLPKGKPSSDWGSPHFDGPQGRLLIAASCRIMPHLAVLRPVFSTEDGFDL
jgi:hypothetical protein